MPPFPPRDTVSFRLPSSLAALRMAGPRPKVMVAIESPDGVPSDNDTLVQLREAGTDLARGTITTCPAAMNIFRETPGTAALLALMRQRSQSILQHPNWRAYR